jgi:hypothetical protein
MNLGVDESALERLGLGTLDGTLKQRLLDRMNVVVDKRVQLRLADEAGRSAVGRLSPGDAEPSTLRRSAVTTTYRRVAVEEFDYMMTNLRAALRAARSVNRQS